MIEPDSFSDGWARPATLADVAYLAENMRAEDRAELWAAGYTDALDALVTAFLHCRHNWTIAAPTSPDRVLGMFGIADAPEETVGAGVGIIWAIFTPQIAGHKARLLRAARGWLDHAQGDYPVLYNAVWTQNEEHLRWAAALGFRLLDPVVINGHDFKPIIRTR